MTSFSRDPERFAEGSAMWSARNLLCVPRRAPLRKPSGSRLNVFWVIALVVWFVIGDVVDAQPRRLPRRPTNRATEPAVEDAAAFWRASERIERDFQRRGLTPPVWTLGDGKVAAVIEKAHIGLFYESGGPSRFLALRLQIGNRSPQPVVIAREQIQAEIDGDEHSTVEIKPQLVYHGFTYADEHYALSDCQPVAELRVPPDGVAATWLVYGKVGSGQTVPPVKLKVTLDGQTRTIDVTALQRALLDLTIERLGPKDCLALVTVGGRLNTFNMQSLIEELDVALSQKVTRAVIRFKPDAPPPDHQLGAWLHSSAAFAGSGRTVSEQLPVIPAALRELHLVQLSQGVIPGTDAAASMPTKLHPTELEAVAAALRTAYFALSPGEIRQAIRTGSALSRAAALMHGGDRLETDDLPLLIGYSRDTNASIRIAALTSLGGFGDPAAIERLTETVRSGAPHDAQAAVQALAQSRFQGARDALLRLLADADPAVETRIVTVLAAKPRGDWSDVLFDHAKDPAGKLRVDVLRALVRLEHSRIVDLLEEALRGSDTGLRDLAFSILARRSDPRSDKLATEYVLRQIEEQPPTGPVLEFLNRTRDPRALPAVQRHLATATDKVSLINLLGQMGDLRTGTHLIELFPKLASHEQVAALNAVRTLKHPGFIALARGALGHKDPTVINHAVQGLTQEGSARAQEILLTTFESATQPQQLQPLAIALAQFATPAAREALQKAAQSKDRARANAGRSGLQNLRMRSPGMQYVHQAATHLAQKQFDEARQLFQIAAELDPFLPEAHIGVGQMHLREKQWVEAGKAFQKAVDLDPTSAEVHAALGDAYLKQELWSEAAAAFIKARELNPRSGLVISGLAIAQVMQGNIDTGLATAETSRKQFGEDATYLYNTACVYGRAVQQIARQPASPERDARLDKLRRQALTDLQAALEHGFDDLDWLREDPDLASLHDLPEFQKLGK
jgi:tetratricopeptide (TPR) repeat protein/HEAT repeat protein